MQKDAQLLNVSKFRGRTVWTLSEKSTRQQRSIPLGDYRLEDAGQLVELGAEPACFLKPTEQYGACDASGAMHVTSWI